MACGCNKERKCKCPFCDAELELSCFEPAFCQPCGLEIIVCPHCKEPYSKQKEKSHKCKK